EVATENTHDAMALLMEADALRREASAGLADPGTVYRRAGDPSDHALPVGAWDVLSFVDGLRSARTVASESDLSETRALRLLKELEERGILRALPNEAPEPTVLVVSSSPALQRLMRLALQRVGLRPLLFDAGADALASLDETRPSVMIVD